MVSWLWGWLVGWLVGEVAGWAPRCFLAGWLFGWLVVWLAGWFVADSEKFNKMLICFTCSSPTLTDPR